MPIADTILLVADHQGILHGLIIQSPLVLHRGKDRRRRFKNNGNKSQKALNHGKETPDGSLLVERRRQIGREHGSTEQENNSNNVLKHKFGLGHNGRKHEKGVQKGSRHKVGGLVHGNGPGQMPRARGRAKGARVARQIGRGEVSQRSVVAVDHPLVVGAVFRGPRGHPGIVRQPGQVVARGHGECAQNAKIVNEIALDAVFDGMLARHAGEHHVAKDGLEPCLLCCRVV